MMCEHNHEEINHQINEIIAWSAYETVARLAVQKRCLTLSSGHMLSRNSSASTSGFPYRHTQENQHSAHAQSAEQDRTTLVPPRATQGPTSSYNQHHPSTSVPPPASTASQFPTYSYNQHRPTTSFSPTQHMEVPPTDQFPAHLLSHQQLPPLPFARTVPPADQYPTYRPSQRELLNPCSAPPLQMGAPPRYYQQADRPSQ